MGNNISKGLVSDHPKYRELRRGYEGIRSRTAQLEELTKNEDVRSLIAEGAEFVRSALSELEKHIGKDETRRKESERRKHKSRHSGHHRHHRHHRRRKDSNSASSSDETSKPRRRGHQEDGKRGRSPQHRHSIGASRDHMAREHRIPSRYGAGHTEHADMMPRPDPGVFSRPEGLIDSSRMTNWHIPKPRASGHTAPGHIVPGPTATRRSVKGMMKNSGLPRDRTRGLGKSNTHADEFMDKHRSSPSDHPSKDRTRSTQFHTAQPFLPIIPAEEEIEEGSEVTTIASEDSDIEPSQQQQQELPQITVQDGSATRQIHASRERRAMRPRSNRPNIYSRATTGMSGVIA
ncbi:MAG: hypothetical protein M1816_004321 [Peltula sp. TS41687]|nr:MAG: hypothetical protein M1816_004321 [Peltula sp. TS41687]